MSAVRFASKYSIDVTDTTILFLLPQILHKIRYNHLPLQKCCNFSK